MTLGPAPATDGNRIVRAPALRRPPAFRIGRAVAFDVASLVRWDDSARRALPVFGSIGGRGGP